jgi:hypothetical protein
MGTTLACFVLTAIAGIPASPIIVHVIDIFQENVFIATGI